MGKVSIKKNVKPKTIKQKQKQTQNVTVNIGSISKKRGRPKRQTIVKKPIQQPTTQPIVSYNQPIFKQSTPQPIQQPSSLASSILATQSTPTAIKKEEIQQSTLKKALEEQVTNIDTAPEKVVNDLERVRKERIKKFEKPQVVEDPVSYPLFSQILSDKGDDTEEIQALKPVSMTTQTDIPFLTDSSTQTPGDISVFPAVITRRELGLLNRPPTEEESSILNKSLRYSLLDLRKAEQSRAQKKLLQARQEAEQSFQAEEPEEPVEPVEPVVEEPVEPVVEETLLKQPEQRGPAELITETPSESTPLSQPTVELGFGGLSEEPIVTSVGQILPDEPVSSSVLEIKKSSKKKSKTILSPIIPPPPLLQARETAPTILEGLQAQPYVTETLVKGNEIPEAESRVVAKISSPAVQIEQKWQELKNSGLITSKRTSSGYRKSIEELLSEINSISGNETYKPIEKPNKPGPKTVVNAEEIVV